MSQFLVMVAVVMLVPAGCFGLLFWLAWLEDTLVEDVRKSQPRRIPDPILAIAIPAQRQPLRVVPSTPAVAEEVMPVLVTPSPAEQDIAPAAATA